MLKLVDYIPSEELIKKLNQPFCELSLDFLCFENIYNIVAINVPKDKIIIDIGCYMAAQAYFFIDNPLYIGVDPYDSNKELIQRILKDNNIDFSGKNIDFQSLKRIGIKCIPPSRFRTNNSIHVSSDGATWIRKRGWETIIGNGVDLEQLYVICSGVLSEETEQLIMETFPNYTIFSSGKDLIVKGISSEAIYSLFKNGKKL